MLFSHQEEKEHLQYHPVFIFLKTHISVDPQGRNLCGSKVNCVVHVGVLSFFFLYRFIKIYFSHLVLKNLVSELIL